ncbi:hypothetical protein OESDEN_21725 [Oesophagostomum dentatum]|uniref:Uncharacterized protein n=1 Tax=Oesophagostomum dentatum TaxID=61180 RepID=A0A0B1S5B2_OESDE|nr:hypothetical protein OESDEN_21725 [Oesophagostomum dentatum]
MLTRDSILCKGEQSMRDFPLLKVNEILFSYDIDCSTKHCSHNYKCIMVQPWDCEGCDLVPMCYPRYCNTHCRRPCRQIDSDHLYHGCLLMYRQHYNCPVTGCGWADGPPVEGPPPDGGS